MSILFIVSSVRVRASVCNSAHKILLVHPNKLIITCEKGKGDGSKNYAVL